MSADAHAVMLTFPPRELSPLERALVDEWLASAGDIADAYVSTRRSDDPAVYRRVVITEARARRPKFMIHSPGDLNLWVKVTVAPKQVETFPNLRDALNSVRRVLPDGEIVIPIAPPDP